MTFDARSRERLEALGRRLPQPLPLPASPTADPGPGRSPSRRHPLESENDPQQLFRELMAASTDGTVPPHLMERLRDLERRRPAAQTPAPAIPAEAAPADSVRGGTRGKARRPSAAPPPGRSLSAEEQQQYATFAHLLLEDEEVG